MAGQLTYRLFQDADLPGLLQLWQEETHWGSLTPEVWRQWFVDTPYGASRIAIAVDESGDIVGQMIFSPSHVSVDGSEVHALRLSSPILRKDLRRTSMREV